MIRWELIEQVEGLEVVKSVPENRDFSGVHFDSRKVKKGNLFLARKGEHLDGHDYIGQALKNGASLVIGERPVINPDFPYCRHPNVLDFVISLAMKYRQTLKGKLVGITGSVGKTTTKDCLAWLLGEDCTATPGNYNNTLGLPVALLSMPINQKFGVFEMGISEPGEMEVLARILKPDLMMITNVQTSHIGNFGSYEKLLEEKLKSGLHLTENQSLLVGDELKEELEERGSLLLKHLVSSKESFLNEADRKSWIARIGKGPVECLEFSLKASRVLGLSTENLKEKIQMGDLELSPLRMQLVQKGGIEFLLDCYNASLSSYEAFLDSIEDPQDWWFVAGDILELGEFEEQIHNTLIGKIEEKNFQRVLLIGDAMRKVFSKGQELEPSIGYYDSKEKILQEIQKNRPQKVGLKASRGLALESLVSPENWEKEFVS